MPIGVTSQTKNATHAGEFEAAEHLVARHVTGHADAEDVAEAEVEQHLDRSAAVDAAQDGRDRELTGGGGGDLAVQVARVLI